MYRPPKRYLVTSALPYANGPLHIGHLAGAYISGDIYVRFLRMMGKDVVYVCGSDEHGAAITIRAMKEGRTPREIIDTYHDSFVSVFKKLGITFDIYHRTSAPIHHETSQEFFLDLYNKGEFIEKETEQYFDEASGKFLADRYIQGTCPNCQYPEAYGDQCESCGSSLSPTELINPRSTISGEEPILRKTTHWYLALDKNEEWLKEWIAEGKLDGEEVHEPEAWKNHVIGQCRSWLEGGLKPRAMTRDLDWGVDVPHEIKGSKGKKLYVWMDAPIGYISATKQWALDNDEDWTKYWKDKDTALIHFIGKDNIVFHCLIFPALLRTQGEYILPVNVPANQFLNLEGRKISTSRNWAVWAGEYLTDLPGKEDELRYHLIKIMPETKDSEFTWKGFQESVNNELVNNLANFVNRVLVLTNKYFQGIVPEFDDNLNFVSSSGSEEEGFHDAEMLFLHDEIQELNDHLRRFDFRGALKKLMVISSSGNQLLQFNEPWKAIKNDEEGVKVVMNLAIQIVVAISVAMQPFIPFASARLRKMLDLPELKGSGELDDLLFKLAEGEELIQSGHLLGKGEHLFSKLSDEAIEEQINKMKSAEVMSQENTSIEEKPIKDEISYEDFTKLDIRIARVEEAERVPKTDKLMKLTLDVGGEKRTVVSGIAAQFDPEEVVGRKVSLLANLAPRKLRGVLSEGMILMAEDGNGVLSFVSPDDSIPEGSIVR